MKRLILLALVLLPSGVSGQATPYNPYAPAAGEPTARDRRAARERAVARIGPVSRGFVEKYGDDACAALGGTSKAMGQKLCEFHNSGELGKLAKPTELLRVIAQKQGGDDLVVYVIAHSRELGDIDQLDALLASPAEYSLGLKELTDGAAEARARRLSVKITPEASSLPAGMDFKIWMWITGIASGVMVVIIWNRWRQKASASLQ